MSELIFTLLSTSCPTAYCNWEKKRHWASGTFSINGPSLEQPICFLSLVCFLKRLAHDKGDETGLAPNFRYHTHKKKRNREAALHRDPRLFSLHYVCWWFIQYDTCSLSHWCFALAHRSSAFPPPLFFQQLDAVVDVKFDGPPVSLVAHQHRAEFEAALTVRLCWDSQLHEVSL